MSFKGGIIFIMEVTYKEYKQSWKSFYKQCLLFILVLILACAAGFLKPLSGWSKLIWIAAIVIDVLLLLYIIIQRANMSLILRDNPAKPEDQEVAFIVCHPFKPFSSDFRESLEIGLANIMHIKVGQTMVQTMLNIGDIVITSSGTGSEEIKARNIPDPLAVRDEIQVHARRYAPHVTPSAPEA